MSKRVVLIVLILLVFFISACEEIQFSKKVDIPETFENNNNEQTNFLSDIEDNNIADIHYKPFLDTKFNQEDCITINLMENEKYVMDQDINCSFNYFTPAFRVLRDNAELDCRGHNIISLNDDIYSNTNGIWIYAVNNFTLKNCNIKGFHMGVYFAQNSSYTTVYNNIFLDNNYGLWGSTEYANISNNIIKHSRDDGLGLYSSHSNIIKENIISNTTIYSGLDIYDSDNNTIDGNLIYNNGEAGIFIVSNPLLGVNHGNNIIKNNLIINNGGGEIALPQFYDGIIIDDSSDNVIYNNTISQNKFYGLLILGDDIYSNKNTVYANNISNNKYGIGLYGLANYNKFTNNVACNNYGSDVADFYCSGEEFYELYPSNTSGENNHFYGINPCLDDWPKYNDNYLLCSGFNICGDGLLDINEEECDDGNKINTDSCTNECKLTRANDGICWQGHEQCGVCYIPENDSEIPCDDCLGYQGRVANCNENQICMDYNPTTGEPGYTCALKCSYTQNAGCFWRECPRTYTRIPSSDANIIYGSCDSLGGQNEWLCCALPGEENITPPKPNKVYPEEHPSMVEESQKVNIFKRIYNLIFASHYEE